MGTFNGDSQGFDHLTTSGGRMLVFWWRSSCWTMEHKGYTLWFVNGLFEYDWNIDDLTYPLVVLQFAESQLGLTRIQQTKGYQVAIFIAMWGFNKPKGIDADCWTTAGWVVVTGVCTTWKWLGAEASTMKHEHVVLTSYFLWGYNEDVTSGHQTWLAEQSLSMEVCSWKIFQCHVWLPEGNQQFEAEWIFTNEEWICHQPKAVWIWVQWEWGCQEQ